VENLEHGDPEKCMTFWERELLVEDVNRFGDLARSETPAASLRARTGDRPKLSARYREYLRPIKMDDELRAVLRVGRSTWGELVLLRENGRARFTSAETALVASLSAPLGEALRARARIDTLPIAEISKAPGIITFDRSGAMISINDDARAWLDELPPDGFPRGRIEASWIVAPIIRARAMADERDHETARVRIRTLSGRWLVCHASRLLDANGEVESVALVIEPAQAAELAPIVVQAYELSQREAEVLRLVTNGTSTADIARILFISTHTVRDHIKAILRKFRVSSRGELVAKVFGEQCGPPGTSDESALVANEFTN
jgi:DNA-binding CsgD family transcriptional regulator